MLAERVDVGPAPATVTDRYTAWAAAHADASWAEGGRPLA